MKKEVKILLGVGLLVIAGGLIGANYYRKSVQSVPVAATVNEALVRPDSPSLGPADAKVTVVEFLDPECETCASFSPVVKSLMKEFDGKVRFVVRYAAFHKNAKPAAIHTEAAGEQGKYWEMQEKLFAKQGEWGEVHGAAHQPSAVTPPAVSFEKYAQELGLNMDQFKASVSDPKHAAKVDRDMKDLQTMGVKSTPTFFVNGRKLARLNQQDLRALINEELKK
ncbi:MAG: DsbA family protein [Saprospiraceae bacterium]|nr:DsbA family protein [Pyrinomonadaceae bacterium]